jgi:hypothetical protein
MHYIDCLSNQLLLICASENLSSYLLLMRLLFITRYTSLSPDFEVRSNGDVRGELNTLNPELGSRESAGAWGLDYLSSSRRYA